MTALEKNPLTWFVIVNLALLFISGCWMVGSLMVASWKSSLGFARPSLLASTALANIAKEDPARRVTVYAFTVGIPFLMVSMIMLCWIVVSTSPYYSFDWRKNSDSSFCLDLGISMALSVPVSVGP